MTREAATAKLHATETAQKVIDTAVQLHGFDYPERLDAGAVVVNTMPMLRAAVSAGETLPKPVCDEWMEKTGKPMLDRIGSTEMLHTSSTIALPTANPAAPASRSAAMRRG